MATSTTGATATAISQRLERMRQSEFDNCTIHDRLAQYCAKWREESSVEYVDGTYMSDSLYSLFICAMEYDKCYDAHYTLKDFNLIRIPDCFLHDDDEEEELPPVEKEGGEVILTSSSTTDAPLPKARKRTFDEINAHLIQEDGEIKEVEAERITRMTLQELMSMLWGLEWAVFSDLFRPMYSERWWKQVKTLFHIIVSRLFYFMITDQGPAQVNMKEYRIAWTVNLDTGETTGAVRNVEREAARYRSSSEEEEEESEEEEEDMDATSSEEEEEEDKRRGPSGFKRKKRKAPKMSAEEKRKLKRLRKRVMIATDAKPKLPAPPKKKKQKKDDDSSSDDDDEEEAPDASLANIEKAVPNVEWQFDVDAILGHFWNHAFMHETTPVPQIIPHQEVDVGYFRSWLFDHVRNRDEYEVVRLRRMWYEDMVVTPAYLRIHMRKSPMEYKPASRAIIIEKNDMLYVQHCLTKSDVCDDQDKDTSVLKRLSTDSMFRMEAKTLDLMDCGNLFEAVFRKSVYDVDSPLCIYRDPIRNMWIVYMTYEERFALASFTAAFIYMRRIMRQRGMEPLKKKVRLDTWDDYFERPQSLV